MTSIPTRNTGLNETRSFPRLAVRLLPMFLLFAALLPLSAAPPSPPPDNKWGGMERPGDRRNSGIRDGVDLSRVGWINDELTTQLLKKLEEAVQSHNQKLLDRYDRDGDGILSSKEKKQLKADISGSGNDRREPPDRNNSRNKSHKSSRQKDTRHSSSQQDEKNVNGVDLSKLGWIEKSSLGGLQTQLKKAIERHNQNLLKRYDKNKNGKLDEDELAQLNSDITAKTSDGGSSEDRRPPGPTPGNGP